MVLFGLFNFLIVVLCMFCCYVFTKTFGFDEGTAVICVFIMTFFLALLYLNVVLFFPKEVQEYKLRNEAERIIFEQNLQEHKIESEIRIKAKERKIQQMIQQLKEKQKGF